MSVGQRNRRVPSAIAPIDASDRFGPAGPILQELRVIGLILLAASAMHRPSACSLPTGWREIDARRPRFVIFGETHGTQESPAMVGQVACALSSRGQPVVVAVELDASSNPELQQLWKSPVPGFRERIVRELPGFAGRLDGIGSEAMLDLIDKLHALSKAGKRIDIVAFNGARDASQERRWSSVPHQAAHEAEQAENIAAAAAAKPHDVVLVLVGNAHAQKRPIESSDLRYEPMAMRLAGSGSIVSLNEIYSSGTTWNCLIRRPSSDTTGMTSDCGSHKIGSDLPPPKTQLGFWASPQQGWNAGYDGYYWFPVVHGAPPVTTAKRE